MVVYLRPLAHVTSVVIAYHIHACVSIVQLAEPECTHFSHTLDVNFIEQKHNRGTALVRI